MTYPAYGQDARPPHRVEVWTGTAWIIHEASSAEEADRAWYTCAPLGRFAKLYINGELVRQGSNR